jgi:hypothetical protein
LTGAEELALGAAVAAARARGVAWKLLMRRYGLGRTKLNELWAAARRQTEKKDVREHLRPGQAGKGNGYGGRSPEPADRTGAR